MDGRTYPVKRKLSNNLRLRAVKMRLILALNKGLCLLLCSYLALRMPNEAAAVLARRSDCQALRAATHVCLVAGEMSSFKNFAERFIQECLIIGDWLSVSEVLGWHTSLKVTILKFFRNCERWAICVRVFIE